MALYPSRTYAEIPSIMPGTHGGAVTGEWANDNCTIGTCFQITVGPGLAAPLTIIFETASPTSPNGDTADVATIEQMGNCDICDGAGGFVDGTYTLDPADPDYVANGFASCRVCVCCPKKFVRAVSDAAGDYSVSLVGMSTDVEVI